MDNQNEKIPEHKRAQHYNKDVSIFAKGHGILGIAADFVTKLCRSVYRRETFIILSFDLLHRQIPSPKPPDDADIRLLTHDDISCFQDLWHSHRALKTMRFMQRMERGYIGTSTWHNGKLIGVNWLAADEDYDPFINLLIKMSPGSCLALDLQEDEEFRNQRVGLATLAYSMREAKKRGFRNQYIVVSDQNRKMLAGAKYLMGFKQVGQIKTTYWFRMAHSCWHYGDRTGRSKTMVLGDNPPQQTANNHSQA